MGRRTTPTTGTWTPTPTQRWWVDQIKDDRSPTGRRSATRRRGSMTVSGYVSGGFDATPTSSAPTASTTSPPTWSGRPSIWRRRTASSSTRIDPFNEPNTNYWGTQLGADGQPAGGRQEGAHVGPGSSSRSIARARRALRPARRPTPASRRWTRPTPASSPRTGTATPPPPRPRSTSSTCTPTAPASAPACATSPRPTDKPLWMSEVEGNWGHGQTSRHGPRPRHGPAASSTTCASWSRRPGCSGSRSRTTTT